MARFDFGIHSLAALAALLAVIGPSPPAAAADSPPAPALGCTSAESRQFDFWVGRWQVYAKDRPDRKVADSLIEKLYNGCGVRENWSPLSKATGGSLSAYDTQKKTWRQFWIDSSASIAEFSGGWTGQAMVIAGVWPAPGHPDEITRMTYTPLPDGAVEQAGVTSDDGGKTWQPSFDFIYRPGGS